MIFYSALQEANLVVLQCHVSEIQMVFLTEMLNVTVFKILT